MEITTNTLGVNIAIKINPDEDLLKAHGFKFVEEPNYPERWPIPPHWHYSKFYTYKSLEVTFSVTYYIIPYKGSQLGIDLIDDDFCQPYDYQRILASNPKNEYALAVRDFVENEMEKLQGWGILSGHVRGEYI